MYDARIEIFCKQMKTMTYDECADLLEYNRKTGELLWKKSLGRAKPGSVAGYTDTNGYVRLCIKGRMYLAHRIAWLMTHGEWPKNSIDHVNGIKHDNRIENIRSASQLENCQNRQVNRNNKTGFPGVDFHKRSGKFRAKIGYQFKAIHLGYFDNPQDAHKAYLAAKKTIHTFAPDLRASSQAA